MSDLGWGGMPGTEWMSTDEAVGDWCGAEWAEWFAEEVQPTGEWETLKDLFDIDGRF